MFPTTRAPTTALVGIECSGLQGTSRSMTSGRSDVVCSADGLNTALACNVYISQGRDEGLIEDLKKELAKVSMQRMSRRGKDGTTRCDLRLGHVFVDASYNRTGFTLVGLSVEAIVQGTAALSKKALSSIDLREHAATHPRLGVVDHISCHALQHGRIESSEAASMCAKEIGRFLGDECGVPTYLYGSCNTNTSEGIVTDTSLASIRRQFGYFKASASGMKNIHGHQQEWKGLDRDWLEAMNSVTHMHPPDFGPSIVPDKWGIACVGSVPWVINHNVVLNTADVDIARTVARRVSERGGGLKAVQAMGLEIDQRRVEVACNLLHSEISDCDMVDSYIKKELEANYRGVNIVKSYQTGKSVPELVGMLSCHVTDQCT